jgi:hypothetical protein
MNNEEKTLEKIQTEFYKTATWYFSQRSTPTGFFKTVGLIKENLTELNVNIKESNESSMKLSSALNRITRAGVIVGGLGVAVAFGHLLVAFLK